MKNIIKELIYGARLDKAIDKGTRVKIMEEVEELRKWHYEMAKKGHTQSWSSGLACRPNQYSIETMNFIRNKSLEIFLAKHKNCEIVRSEPGFVYENYNVLIKVKIG